MKLLEQKLVINSKYISVFFIGVCERLILSYIRCISGTISVFYGATLGTMYSEFSQALSRYTHNLLARNTLSENLQNTLLHHLGVNPWSGTDGTTPCTWPLQVYPRTLSVLAQVYIILEY